MPLDDFLTGYDVNEVHATRVAAPPDAVLAAVRELTAREVPLVVMPGSAPTRRAWLRAIRKRAENC